MASDPDRDAGLPVGHPVRMTPSTATPATSVAVGAAVTFGDSPGAPTRGTGATRAPTALDELDELEQSDSDDGGGLFYLPQAFASGDNDTSTPVDDNVPVGTLVSGPAPASPVPPPRTVPSAVPAAPPAVVMPVRPAPAQPAPDVPVEGSQGVSEGSSGGGVPGSAPAPVVKPRRRPAPAAPVAPRRRHSPRPATNGGTPPAGDANVAAQASGGGGSGRGSAPAYQRRGSTDGSGDMAAQAAAATAHGAVESGADEEAARAAAAAAAARDAHDMNIAVNHMGEKLFQEMLEPAKKLDALQAHLQDVVTGNTPAARARKEARRKAKEERRAERAIRRAERAAWRAERRMARATGRPLPPRPPQREGSFRSLESDDDDWNDDAGEEHTDGSNDSAEDEAGPSMAHDATRISTGADGVDSAYGDDTDGDAVGAAVPLAIRGAAVSYA